MNRGFLGTLPGLSLSHLCLFGILHGLAAFLDRLFPGNHRLGASLEREHRRKHRDQGNRRHPAGEQPQPGNRFLLQFGSLTFGVGQRPGLFQFSLPLFLRSNLVGASGRITRLKKFQGQVKSSSVTLAPGCWRLNLVHPGQGDLQIRTAIKSRLVVTMQTGCLGQTQVNLGRLGFIPHPAVQPLPDPHQALVRYVDNGLGVQFRAGRRHQERDTGGPIRIDDPLDLVGIHTHNLTQQAHRGRPPDSTIVTLLLGQCLEKILGNPFQIVRLQGIEHLISMPRQRLLHASHIVVMPKINRLVGRTVGCPPIKRPHQRVLQDRQLILVAADAVEQFLDKAIGNLTATNPHRPFDGGPDLVAGQAGNQVFPLVDRGGQATELRTVAQVITSHRQHDVDRLGGLLGRFQQQVDETRRHGRRTFVHPPEPENLLELIDNDQDIGARFHVRLLDRLDQAEAAMSQRRGQVSEHLRIVRIIEIRVPDGRGQVVERIPAGSQDHNLPVRSRLVQSSPLEFRQEPRTDK